MTILCNVFRYLMRFDGELEEIQKLNSIKGRQGRPQAAREDAIEMVLEKEKELFTTCGIGKQLKAATETVTAENNSG